MALCFRCGGVRDFTLPAARAQQPPIEADPYCPECGEPRHRTCARCGGSGYVNASVSVRLIREYCAACGEPLVQKTRVSCPTCGGSGRTGHFCSGWRWFAGRRRQPGTMLVATAVTTKRAIVLRPKRSRTLVKRDR